MSAPHQRLPTPAVHLCMPREEWPARDRTRWNEAVAQPATRRRSIHDPLPPARSQRSRRRRGKPSTHFVRRTKPLSPQRLADLERAYGLWLRYLGDHEALDLAGGPVGGVNDDRIDGFVSWLQEYCTPSTVHTYLQRFLLAVRLLAPTSDWTALATLVRRLTPPPPDPTRRLADVRHPAEFLALAEHLMNTADEAVAVGRSRRAAAIRYRDGLMLAVLVFAALRRGSLLKLELGTTLLPVGDGFLISLRPEHTKARRPEVIPLHPILRGWIQRYLDHHRPVLLKGRGTNELWIIDGGAPLQENGVWHAIRRRTEACLGVAINPHFLRHCIGTTTAIEHPEAIAGLPAVLQHRDFRVTERHYILAHQLQARVRYRDALEAEREALCDVEVPADALA